MLFSYISRSFKLGSPGLLPQSNNAIGNTLFFSPSIHSVLTSILRFVVSWLQYGSGISRHHALIQGWRKGEGQRAFSEWGFSRPLQQASILWAHLLILRTILEKRMQLLCLTWTNHASSSGGEVGAWFLWEQGLSTPTLTKQDSVVREEGKQWLLCK